MTTAKDFAKAAIEIGKLAEQMNPGDSDPVYEQSRKLIVTYLRMAATKAREIAEHKAAKGEPA